MPSSLLSTLPLSCEICLSSPQPYEAGHNSEKVEALFIFGFTYVSVLVPALSSLWEGLWHSMDGERSGLCEAGAD